MVAFIFEELLASGPAGFQTGIADLDIYVSGGQPVLYSATRPGGGVLAYALTDTGPQLIDQEALATGTGQAGPMRLELIQVEGSNRLAVFGGQNAVVSCLEMGAQGQLSAGDPLIAQGGFPGAVVALETVSVGTLDLAYSGNWGVGGIAAYTMDAAGQLTQIGQTGGGSGFQGADLVAIEAIALNGQTYLVTASAAANAVTSYGIGVGGMPVEIASVGADDGLGIAAPSALAAVSLGGAQFVVLAGAGSGSLSVLRLDPGGALVPVDHAIDGGDTRFAAVTALETVTIGDRVFLVAGGGDDGLSLLTLLPGGRLLHLAQIADNAATGLTNVTALALRAVNGVIEVFAAGEGEEGITRLTVDPGALGPTVAGTAAAELMVGGTAADLIDGGGGADTLRGGDGDDILVDGAGADRLTGGTGADIFVFAADGEIDRVTDFEVQSDRLDLSALGLIRSVDQLGIQSTATGAVITYGDETIIIQSAGSMPLSAADFATALLLDLSHQPVGNLTYDPPPPPPPPDPDMTLQGGTGEDTLLGGSGNDTLAGGGGANAIDGGAGTDLLDFSAATGRAFADIQIDQRGAGFLAFYDVGQPQGDTYANIENITGGAYADNLRGNGGDNVLWGGGVSDRVYGRAGDDVLFGGTGADALYGNLGVDTMTGGADAGRRDRFIYFDIDESGVGAGNRDVITDFTPGEDRIEISRFDADTTQNGNQAFSFIGAAAFSTAGQLRYVQSGGNTVVQADVDGDGLADFEIELSGLMALSAGDFLL